jgi:hypothetical protein
MFRAAHRSSLGALNCICSLWFIYTCGDLPLSRLSGKMERDGIYENGTECTQQYFATCFGIEILPRPRLFFLRKTE